MNFIGEIKRFLKFNIVGLINTLVDAVVYAYLSGWGMNIALAQGISYALGMVNSYVFNSRWTFKDKRDSAVRILLFLAVSLASYGVSIAILYFLKGRWGLVGLIAKLIALPFSTALNFAGMRLLVFRNRNEQKKEPGADNERGGAKRG